MSKKFEQNIYYKERLTWKIYRITVRKVYFKLEKKFNYFSNVKFIAIG